MITGGILLLIYGFVWLVLAPIRVLPDASIPAGIGSAISVAGGYLGAIDNFFPISTLFIVIGAITAIEIGVMLYKITMWVIRKIPGIG